MDALKFMQANYFSTASNNAQSAKQKLEIIQLICFLTQIMQKKNPEKYSNALAVLGVIFNTDFNNNPELVNGDFNTIRSFGMICDDILWGTNEQLDKPEGYSSAKDIKDKIVNYFSEEWAPF
jgi:hypothetical protein